MKALLVRYPYPAPAAASVIGISYDALCDSWARRLSEGVLRELTVDYMRGLRTEEVIDAHEEFLRREAAGLLKQDEIAGSSPRSARSRKGNRSSAASRHRRV
jgi:hypothetical protein